MSYSEQYEEEMWEGIVASHREPVGSWLVKVPVMDGSTVVDWRPKMVIPNVTEREALRLAREAYGPKADVWPH
jgi:hypothetical protein